MVGPARTLAQASRPSAGSTRSPTLGELTRWSTKLVKNPDKVASTRRGKTGLLGFFVGQVVKASGGKADPRPVSKRSANVLPERDQGPSTGRDLVQPARGPVDAVDAPTDADAVRGHFDAVR